MKLTFQPDPHMEWIYDPKYLNDPQAKDLRERRAKAIQSAPRWMIEQAMLNEEFDNDK